MSIGTCATSRNLTRRRRWSPSGVPQSHPNKSARATRRVSLIIAGASFPPRIAARGWLTGGISPGNRRCGTRGRTQRA